MAIQEEKIMGIPEATVKTRMFHARRRLKAYLPPLLGARTTRGKEASTQ